MLVRHFMTREVAAFSADTSCEDAWRVFVDKGLRRAPVERDGQVIGMIADRDLLRVLPWSAQSYQGSAGRQHSNTTVGEIVKRGIISVGPGDHLETAARRMLEHKVGALPVLQDGQLVGIITESDIFRIFVSLKDRSDGVRLTLHWPAGTEGMPDPARVALVTGVEIREHFRHESPAGGELVGLRVRGGDIDAFQSRLLGSGFLLIDREDFGKSGE